MLSRAHLAIRDKSPEVNFIIADVGFKSLFALKGNRDSKVFVCGVE
jgi:hypothetical protein